MKVCQFDYRTAIWPKFHKICITMIAVETPSASFLPGIFLGGGGAKSIVTQISFVMLIFLLFSDQISGGGANCLRGTPPAPPPPRLKKASLAELDLLPVLILSNSNRFTSPLVGWGMQFHSCDRIFSLRRSV